MIRTSCYKNWHSTEYQTYSISGDRGKKENYERSCYIQLAPKYSFWKIWHDNKGRVLEEQNNQYYIEEYYRQVLSKLDPEQVYRELDHSVLLCYEQPTEFCHRHIVAAWLELLLDIKVPEQSADAFGVVEEQRPEYIKTYLEQMMKETKDMRGYHSLRALYLLEKAERLEQEAERMESESQKRCDGFRIAASYLRDDAKNIEDASREKKLLKTQ